MNGERGLPLDQLLPETAAARLREFADRGDLRAERVWPLGNSGWLLCCGVGTGPDVHYKRSWAVVDAGAKRLPALLRRALGRHRVQPLPGAPRLVAFEARRDPALPALKRILAGDSPAELRERLRIQDGLSLRPRFIRYKPLRRAVVRLRLTSIGSANTHFLKLLRPTDYRATLDIYRALAHAEDLPVAQPAANLDGICGLLWRRAAGSAPGSLTDEARHHAAAAAGAALARLHGASTVLPRRHPRERELATVRRWLDAVDVLPETPWKPLAEATFSRLAEATDRSSEGPLVPSHRDFHPDQLLFDGEGATLLDLDTAAMAERELDLGNFLAHLRLPPFAVERRSLADAFFGGYGRLLRTRGVRQPADLARLPLYEASACLRLACVYRFRPGGGALGRRLVEAARDLLCERRSSRRML